ncbi:MAG: acetyl-CoA carboxylase biotin carboxyl carrier protein [Ignavibacteriae bacterium]|nr:acetyl-CoA carboxylase biotin carboxyl carrier protein [Ignavibacteriota bacterium]
MKMDLNYLKKLIKMLDSSNLAEIEIEEQGSKIKLSKPKPKISQNIPTVQLPNYFEQNFTARNPQEANTESKAEEKKEDTKKSDNIVEIRSPMVGTFYSAPSPDADPYVKVGSEINAGNTICIIEAMKLMNEIESEVSGKVVEILAKNGQAVEYDQPLFLIEKK